MIPVWYVQPQRICECERRALTDKSEKLLKFDKIIYYIQVNISQTVVRLIIYNRIEFIFKIYSTFLICFCLVLMCPWPKKCLIQTSIWPPSDISFEYHTQSCVDTCINLNISLSIWVKCVEVIMFIYSHIQRGLTSVHRVNKVTNNKIFVFSRNV